MAITQIIGEYEAGLVHDEINRGITPERQQLYSAERIATEQVFDDFVAERPVVWGTRSQTFHQAAELGRYVVSGERRNLAVLPIVRLVRYNITLGDRIGRILRLYVPSEAMLHADPQVFSLKNSALIGERAFHSSSRKASVNSINRLEEFQQLLHEVIGLSGLEQ